MKRFWLAPAAIAAVAIGLSVSAAQSAPAMSTLDGLRATATEQGVVTDVRRRSSGIAGGTAVTATAAGTAGAGRKSVPIFGTLRSLPLWGAALLFGGSRRVAKFWADQSVRQGTAAIERRGGRPMAFAFEFWSNGEESQGIAAAAYG